MEARNKSGVRKYYTNRYMFWVILIYTFLIETVIFNWSINIPIGRNCLLFLEHLSSAPVFSGICVTPSLVLCVMFCRLLFGHCAVCSSSIYGFWLPLWYLQTLLVTNLHHNVCKTVKFNNGCLYNVKLTVTLIIWACLSSMSYFSRNISIPCEL